MSRVVVIGAGLAGLLAAGRLVQGGAEVILIGFGIGGLQLGHGCLDVLGRLPMTGRPTRPAVPGEPAASAKPALGDTAGNEHPAACLGAAGGRPEPGGSRQSAGGMPGETGCGDDRHRRDPQPPGLVQTPLAAVDGLPGTHPYRVLGRRAIKAGMGFAADFFGPGLLTGGLAGNLLLPTALGVLRPTAYASPSMVGPLDEVVVVGLRQLKDFQPGLLAENLRRTLPAARVRSHWVDLPARAGEADSSALHYARALAEPRYRRRFVQMIGRVARGSETLLLPAILGLAAGDWQAIARAWQRPVAEVPLPPPSVPGMRLNSHALARLRAAGVRIIDGSRVTGLRGNARVHAVQIATAGHPTAIGCDAVIHAGGGFESGTLALDSRGRLTERLGLPVWRPAGPAFVADRRADQPLWRAGLLVDAQARVLDQAGLPVYENLFAAGGILAGAVRWREYSGEGIAAASALRAAEGALA